MKTVNITDYKVVGSLAKVVISFTGELDKEFIKSELCKKLDYCATPVANSFKLLRSGVAVGFVRANKAIRMVSASQISASYRVMSSNILMDNDDKTLWDVKEGSNGKYLARHGQEDLAALISANTHRRSDIPALRNITIAKAAPEEIVAFVDSDGDVDYGFAIATNDEKTKVVSYYRRIPMTVPYENVISIFPVTVPKELKSQVLSSMTAAEKAEAANYWRRLYSYDKDYMDQTIKQVNETTTL